METAPRTVSETLQRAATALREVLPYTTSEARWDMHQAATGIRPHRGGDGVYAWVVVRDEPGGDPVGSIVERVGGTLADVKFISLLDPTVGKIVADLLEKEAWLLEACKLSSVTVESACKGKDSDLHFPMLRLALAILRETEEDEEDGS